ncbi:unnamed protein product [Moneuplotes crassus]|uniref:Uncharacterized protein n=2 Tax=Euplotes crassus TaxID=5936 RepID=A0AAD1UFQ4_EUPCR|nr:unnamed protein product [Moneuplotes crassus]
MENKIDPAKSNLARHFAWKERVKKEQNSVYTSLQKCISLKILKQLPLKEEEVLDIPSESKADPYKLLSTLKESTIKEGLSPLRQSLNNHRLQPDDHPHSQVSPNSPSKTLPKIPRLSSNETTPYSEFIIGSQSKMNREVPLLNERTSGTYYKPQKKQYYGTEKKNYMDENINLQQPRFTYLNLKNKKKITDLKPTQKPLPNIRKSMDNLHQLGLEQPPKSPTPPQKFVPKQATASPSLGFKPKRLLHPSRLSSNGLYLTQNVSCGLDLKESQQRALQKMRKRRNRSQL